MCGRAAAVDPRSGGPGAGWSGAVLRTTLNCGVSGQKGGHDNPTKQQQGGCSVKQASCLHHVDGLLHIERGRGGFVRLSTVLEHAFHGIGLQSCLVHT